MVFVKEISHASEKLLKLGSVVGLNVVNIELKFLHLKDIRNATIL